MRIRSPKLYSHIYMVDWFSTKVSTKAVQWRRDSLFNKWCWNSWIFTCKKVNLSPYCTSYTKIISKWIIDLNIKPNIIKLLEENIGEKSLWPWISKDFQYTTPQTVTLKKSLPNWFFFYEVLVRNIKEWATATCSNMSESQNNCAEQKKTNKQKVYVVQFLRKCAWTT